MEKFSEKLKAARKNAELSQTQLGAMIGVSQHCMTNYERGIAIPRRSIVQKLADVLGVIPEYFMNDEIMEPYINLEHNNCIENTWKRHGTFEGKVSVVTGGAHGIGKAITDAFRAEGAIVHIIDKESGDWFVGDVGDKKVLERFSKYVIRQSGHVDYVINNALPIMKGINECSYDEFNQALAVGVTAPFYLTKLLMPHFAPGAVIINISSSRDRMSQPQTESYTAAKGGVTALTHALAVSLAGKVRVNSISPGWINTKGINITKPDEQQQPVGRIGKPEDIAEMVLFLCSEKAGFITGENICIDGGMTKLMVYHGEYGWEYRP